MISVDDALRAAIAFTDRAPSLSRLPAVKPLDGQARIVGFAITAARVCGLELPKFFDVKYVNAHGRGRSHGETLLSHDGRLVVVLDASILPSQLELTALHEMQHVADFAVGRYRKLSRLELEKRAIAFVARVKRWA